MKRIGMLLILLSVGTFSFIGCQEAAKETTPEDNTPEVTNPDGGNTTPDTPPATEGNE